MVKFLLLNQIISPTHKQDHPRILIFDYIDKRPVDDKGILYIHPVEQYQIDITFLKETLYRYSVNSLKRFEFPHFFYANKKMQKHCIFVIIESRQTTKQRSVFA